MYVQHLDKKKFGMFYCAVDLDAWRSLKAETYQLPDPIDMGNEFCSEKVLDWYLVRYPGIINPNAIHYFFDHNEPFKLRFEGKWNQGKVRRARAKEGEPLCKWDLIGAVTTAEMKKIPGLQAADILAWSVNRENTNRGDVPGVSLAHIMRNIIPSLYAIWDEGKTRAAYSRLIYRA